MPPDRNLLLRVASAAVGLPLLGALVLWRQPLALTLLALLVAGLATGEYARLALPGRPAFERAAVVVAGVGLAAGLVSHPHLGVVWIAMTVIGLGGVALARPDDVAAALGRLGASVFGACYVGGLISALPLLHRLPGGSRWVVVALAATFANDTGAYFVGRALGRRKLAPAISPGKTVEGLVGGLAAALAFMAAARATFLPALGLGDCAVIGIGVSILGPLGDLLESLIKRSAGVKDSGRLIPGHGGMLDRIDAILFTGAFVYVYVHYLR